MKKTKLSFDAMLRQEDSLSLNHLFNQYDMKFEQRFGFKMPSDVNVTLEFESSFDAQLFYTEVRHNMKYAEQYTVTTHPYDVTKLRVGGAPTLFDYFGTREPNLLTLSRENNINFKIDYVQEYSNIVFTGEVIEGELLGRHCLVQVSDVLPELSLAGLQYIGRTRSEFETLLTRIFKVESVVLV